VQALFTRKSVSRKEPLIHTLFALQPRQSSPEPPAASPASPASPAAAATPFFLPLPPLFFLAGASPPVAAAAGAASDTGPSGAAAAGMDDGAAAAVATDGCLGSLAALPLLPSFPGCAPFFAFDLPPPSDLGASAASGSLWARAGAGAGAGAAADGAGGAVLGRSNAWRSFDDAAEADGLVVMGFGARVGGAEVSGRS
jgi:hypothetical protein